METSKSNDCQFYLDNLRKELENLSKVNSMKKKKFSNNYSFTNTQKYK